MVGGISLTIRDGEIECLTSLVRLTIGISREVLGFLMAGLRTTLLFFGLATVGWDGVGETPVGSFIAN